MTSLVDIFHQYGIKVQDHRVAPRSGLFTPIGVLNHHTAVKGPALGTCIKGRPDLQGPLCNINIGRDGTINVVSDGRTNNAGKGSSQILRDIAKNVAITKDAHERHLADDSDGNRYFIGVEVDNDGVGEPYSQAVLSSVGMVNAALCLHFGWDASHCVQHRQWTARKVDMSWRGDLTGITRWWMGALTKKAG